MKVNQCRNKTNHTAQIGTRKNNTDGTCKPLCSTVITPTQCCPIGEASDPKEMNNSVYCRNGYNVCQNMVDRFAWKSETDGECVPLKEL